DVKSSCAILFFNGISDSELRSKGVRFMKDSGSSVCVIFNRNVAVTAVALLVALVLGMSAKSYAQSNWADAFLSDDIRHDSVPNPPPAANLRHGAAAQHWGNG